MPELKKYDDHGIRFVEDICPDGYVEVDSYTPNSSNPPYDCAGRKHQGEYRRVLTNAGIESIALETRKTIISPRGTGPCGRVRFGDDMIPHVYRIAVKVVKDGDLGNAAKAFAAHQKAIDQWLHHAADMPQACRA